MIEILNLEKNYGAIQAVKPLTLHVKKGEKLGFLGPNGAGKTTIMNMITGNIPSSGGTVKVCGFDILENPREVKKHIGYLPEQPPLYVDMTVTEFLNFVSALKLVDKRRISSHVAEVLELVNLTDVRHRLIKNLSKGYRQRVGIAQALLGNPEVLILDEPTVGLDPTQIIDIRNLIKSLAHTVILSSHILPEISAVCERIVIINKGEIVAVDTPANLSKVFANNARLTITVVGSKAQVKSAISGIAGITHVDVEEEKEKEVIRYVVEYHRKTDVRGDLSLALTGAGYPILELKALDISLEDIFIQLVTKEKEGEAK